MAIRPIVIAPDPRLKEACAPVAAVDAAVRQLMDDMMESMHEANGIGLAAPQIGVHSRIIVVDVSSSVEDAEPLALANPELVWTSDDLMTNEEGCLSLPDHYAEVTRPAAIQVRYLDRGNEGHVLEAHGILATCIQHEMDHLDGVLFVDHLSALKRNIILRKLTKWKRQQAAEAAE